jgi:hypothetical protein
VFKRKLFAFILTIIIAAPIIGLCFMFIENSTIGEVPGLIAFTSIYAIPVTLLYGVPVSIISDKICDRMYGFKRVFSAFSVHIIFGISFTFFFILITDSRSILTNYNGFDIYFLLASTVSALVFWGMDEILRKRASDKEVQVNIA